MVDLQKQANKRLLQNKRKLRQTPGWGRSGVFIFNFEHISCLAPVFLSLTLRS